MTDVFLMVRRKKSTIFLSCKETDTVAVLKKMLSGIVRQDAEGMKVFQQCDNAEKGLKLDIKIKSCKMFPPKNWTMLHPWNPLVSYRAFASRCLPEQLSSLGMVKPLR